MNEEKLKKWADRIVYMIRWKHYYVDMIKNILKGVPYKERHKGWYIGNLSGGMPIKIK